MKLNPQRAADLQSHKSLERPAKAAGEPNAMSVWRRRALTVFMASLALIMAYGVVFGHNGLTAFAHKREESRQLEEQRSRLDRENERLRGHVERLASDPDVIEHQAREALHYTHADEVIVTLPKAATAQPSGTGK